MLSLDKGNTVKLSVFANYNPEQNTHGNGRIDWVDFLALLTGTYTAVGGSEALTIGSASFDDPLVTATLGDRSSSENSDAPAAYLNYLFFDKDRMLTDQVGFEQISSTASGTNWEELTLEMVAAQKGFLLVYLSNETHAASLVNMDDLIIYHGKPNVVSADDYYPFGLAFNSYSRSYSEPNRFKFQGQEHDDITGWDQFKWRNYMPDIGRFFNVDPLAESYVHNSPYAFAENKVITFIELEGLEGLHYMEALNNGSQRHVIEKNVVVLTRAPRAIPAGSSPKQAARITRQNTRRVSSNAAKVASVSSELNSLFNGSDGQAANSAGEAVRFQFNVTGMEVENTNSLGSNSVSRGVAMENGITGGQPAFNGGPERTAPAAIVTTQPTNQSSTNGITIKVDDTPGATAHEVGHTLMIRGQGGEESRPGSGGLMVAPPSTIRPAEVDKMLQDAIPRINN